MTFYGTPGVKRLTLEKSIKPSNPHTQTIHWLLPTNCLSVFEQFVEMTPQQKCQKWVNLQGKLSGDHLL